MYLDLVRVPQSVLFGFPLISLERELFPQTVRVALTPPEP
jgi:hypothetical protein